MRGSVLDMAVGIIIGAAFGKIITSLVSRHPDAAVRRDSRQGGFLELVPQYFRKPVPLLAAAKAAGAATINYGMFLNNIIDFLIVAFAIFLLVRQVNHWSPKPAAAPDRRRTAPIAPPNSAGRPRAARIAPPKFIRRMNSRRAPKRAGPAPELSPRDDSAPRSRTVLREHVS